MRAISGEFCDRCTKAAKITRFSAAVSITLRPSGWIELDLCDDCLFKDLMKWIVEGVQKTAQGQRTETPPGMVRLTEQ